MARLSGDYSDLGGAPVVRFERTFPHPLAAVWDSITDPERLERWFPTTVEFTALEPGAPIVFRFGEDRYPPMEGEVRAVVPGRLLSFSWGEDVLTFELEGRDHGAACRLAFTVELDSAGKAARDAAGWEQCLDALAEVAGGLEPRRPLDVEGWRAYYDGYRERGLPATAEIPL